MDDLLNDFISETREMLDALGGEVVAWEAEPGDRARLDAIFRFVHTVKGNCGFFELPRLEALSHAAEDALADVRAGRRAPDARLVSAVLAVIDRIGDLVVALEAGGLPDGDDSALVDGLAPNVEIEAAAPREGVDQDAATASNGRSAPLRTIRLSVDLLDRMMSGVSDLVLARNELARRLRESGVDGAVDASFERVSANIAEMREAITRTRMQRVENLFTTLPRMVRDLAKELGKQVLVDVEGGDVELDREMIEMIRDPLTHIIRNAVDHGIELPEARRIAGKREIGLIKVSARQSGNQILIEIADDGRGIDSEKLARRAIATGTLTPDAAERLSSAAKLQLIFEAGLSTAEAVTAISGRGVGMDVVRANVERIGGVVEIDSALGRGTKLTLRVPLTLTIIPALTVSAGGQTFAIPRSAIDEIVRVGGQSVEVEEVGGTAIARIRGRRVAMLGLRDVLGLDGDAVAKPTLIVLRPAGSELFALAVDLVHDHEELVVKPAAPAIMATGLYAGTTLADSGRPMLLLDAAGLAAAGQVDLGQSRSLEDEVAAVAVEGTRALLFRELDGTRRAIRLSVVDRIEEVPANTVSRSASRWRVAIAGRIIDLAGLASAPEGARLRIFRMDDGRRELAYAFGEVVDIIEIAGTMLPSDVPGPVAGVFLLDGEQIEILDPLWLMAQAGAGVTSTEAAVERPICVIPPDDRWLETMLAPLAEQAGYRVVRGGTDAERAAATLHVTGEGSTAVGPSGRVLRLLAEPDVHAADAVHRYDSAAILSALRAARSPATVSRVA